MKKLLLFLWLMGLIPSILIAQEETERYQAGAVPVEDGRVMFTKEVTDNSLSQGQLYDKMLAWAQNRFKDENNRVTYADKDKGAFAVVGMEKLIFTSNALSLDTSEMTYHLILQVTGNTAKIQFTNIHYKYEVSYERTPQRFAAEEVITDEYALTRRNRLNRMNGKFRKGTIDFTDKVFHEIDLLFAGNPPAGTVAQPPAATSANTPVRSSAVKEGYLAFEISNVPQAILAMLPGSPMQVAVSGDASVPVETNVSWKGISEMFGKSVTMIGMDESSPVYKQIKDKYTLSFMKEDDNGAPWMIIECYKQGETSEGESKTVLGEIVQIWIK